MKKLGKFLTPKHPSQMNYACNILYDEYITFLLYFLIQVS